MRCRHIDIYGVHKKREVFTTPLSPVKYRRNERPHVVDTTLTRKKVELKQSEGFWGIRDVAGVEGVAGAHLGSVFNVFLKGLTKKDSILEEV